MTESRPLPLGKRWERVRQSLVPLVLDIALAEYVAFAVLYLLHHDEYNRPVAVETGLLVGLALCALEAGVLLNSLFAGVGPQVCNVRLVSPSGEEPAVGARLLRWLGWHVSIVTGFAGALWGLFEPAGRGLQDRISRTQYRSEIELGQEAEVQPWFRQSVWWLSLTLIGLTYTVGWRITEINLHDLLTGMGSAGPLAKGLLTPNYKILGECLWAMVETIYLALLATTAAVPIAVVLSFFGARNVMPRNFWGTLVYSLMRVFFTITRSIEPIVWAIVFVVWVGLGPFAGMMALLVHSVAALGKLYSEQIEGIDPGPVEALRATGAGPVHTVLYAIWPQVVPPFVAFTLYRWDINVRMATVVGLVGGGGIGLILFQNQQMLRWNEVGLIMWIITLVVWLMDVASARIRERMG